MQEKHLFEYAVIRVVPRVEREEFINAGVIVYCASQRFLQMLYTVNKTRLKIFSDNLELEELEKRLAAIDQICNAAPGSGTIGRLPAASRFRWLTAARSTVVQISAVHPGLSTDAHETLLKLYEQLVL